MREVSLDQAIRNGEISLGRGNIIASNDIVAAPGDYPIYSSSAKGAGEFGRYGHYMFDEELITWSVDGGGRFFFRPKHKFSVTNVCVFMRVDKSKWDMRFVYYSLDLQHKQLSFDYQAKAHPSVIRLLYQLPQKTKPEQAKIAEVLSTVDRAIEQTQGLIAKQQRIKTGLMQDLLTRGIDENRNLRSEETHEFKDSPLGRIPVEWTIEQLGKFTEFVTSGARGWAKYYREEGAIFLRIGNLTRNHINLRLDDLVYVKPPVSAEGRRTCVSEGDLLISVTADLGIIGVIPRRFGEGYVNQHIALARPDRDAVCSRFIGWFFASHQGQSQFERLNESGAKAGLNLPTVRSLLFPKSEYDEQRRIAAILDASISVLDGHLQSRRKLIALKNALMQDLLTGKVRVTELLTDNVERMKNMDVTINGGKSG